ncbi:hypothetical protein EDI_309920 [Entamoeba dispar SAW760]|uniref:Mitochondrial import receptor subunit TOM40 n=1 Tax=Entamoeba dispar (strain ATCC PRA-260 / SAW760) TaxID=370354 RepID=B0EJV0_ENTDS|nr:uncharacterized protein EDI_309920 [Entamoeba dispar SAW760]EDR25202.1 hypothetical protein EDI_309920 [Entamoeba dispar SAW760]|eukprot:EDR25202.1 hypothetical protein EDI_309920 [Entamoeba dispar SAW760]
MEGLLDPHYVCEPYEAIGAINDSLQPECFNGMKIEITKQHNENLVTGHYFTIEPPSPKGQKFNRIHSFLYSGYWGNVIARLDNEMKGSFLSSFNLLSKQISGSFRIANGEDNEIEAGIDGKVTGFGKCFGMRYEKGGLYVLNLMQKITDSCSVGTECCLIPSKKIRTNSYGLLWNITPQIISTFIYSQLNQTLFSTFRYSPSQYLTYGCQFVYQNKPQKAIYGLLAFEHSSQDSSFKTIVNTQGTLSSCFQTNLRQIASNLLLSVQANPFVGSYSWGISIQIFR